MIIINTVTLQYTIRREIEIVSNEELTPAELQARAMASDLTITGDQTDDLFGLRALLRSAECSLLKIYKSSDEFNLEYANAIVKRLNDKNCFAPDGRLKYCPTWLTPYVINALVGFGLLREELGSAENYPIISYYRVGALQ